MISSSHLFLGLPTALFALPPMLRSGLHFAAFLFVHLVSWCDAILIANLHFIFLCDSIQQRIMAVLIFSSACLVLLFMYSTQSSSSVPAVSMSSSVSSMEETSLFWSQSVFELLPSSVSPSEFWWQSFFLRLLLSLALIVLCLLSSLLFFIFSLYFRFVCTMRRGTLRCVYLIIFRVLSRGSVLQKNMFA